MVTPNTPSGAELDVQSDSGTVPTETNVENGETVSGKTLTKASDGSATETGAIQDLAFRNIASELSGTNTLQERTS